jgi:hypothetical protein
LLPPLPRQSCQPMGPLHRPRDGVGRSTPPPLLGHSETPQPAVADRPQRSGRRGRVRGGSLSNGGPSWSLGSEPRRTEAAGTHLSVCAHLSMGSRAAALETWRAGRGATAAERRRAGDCGPLRCPTAAGHRRAGDRCSSCPGRSTRLRGVRASGDHRCRGTAGPRRAAGSGLALHARNSRQPTVSVLRAPRRLQGGDPAPLFPYEEPPRPKSELVARWRGRRPTSSL